MMKASTLPKRIRRDRSQVFPIQLRGRQAATHTKRRRLLLESLETRYARAALTVLGQAFQGGSGDEVGTGIAVVSSGASYDVYVSGASNALNGEGLVAKYGLPNGSGSIPMVWGKAWPGNAGYDQFNGIDATTTDVFPVGASFARTIDSVGDKEQKGITVDFPVNGASSKWERQTPTAPGAFSYGGYEAAQDAAVAIESGQTFVYVSGQAQSGFSNAGRFFLSKLDATGNILWTKTDAAAVTSFSVGSRVVATGGFIYVAGTNADGGTQQAYIKKYDPNGVLIWAKTTAVGAFNGLTVDVATSSIYAVGRTGGTNADFLIEKWDLNGNLAWSKSYDRNSAEDILNGVSLLNGRIYAVGSTRGGTSGGSDGVVLEIDPTTGTLLQSTLWGGSLDDSFADIGVSSNALHVVGTTRSFGTGGSDLVYVVFAATDTTAPTVSSIAPADDSNGVPLTADLKLTFNEAVQKGAGNIVVKKSSNNSIVQTIDVSNTAVTVSGATVTINAGDFVPGTSYYVEVGAGTFKDLANNNFVGISGTTAWNFTTKVVASSCGLQSFADGFEGQQLDPFWTKTETSGFVTVPSTVRPHAGNQSLQLNSTNTASDKWIHVDHTFDTAVYGTFSTWLYDTGADIGSSNYLQLVLTGANDRAALGTNDYDLGAGNNGATYYFSRDNASWTPTSVDRTQAWHKFEIIATPNSVKYSIDGTTVYTENSGLAVKTVSLYMFGPSWRPAWVSYFDDFSFTPANAGLVDFDQLDATLNPQSGEPLANYLAACGLTLKDVSPGTQINARDSRSIYPDVQPIVPTSPYNVLTQEGSNDPVTYTLASANPLASVQFTRPAIHAGPSGIVLPEWHAHALDAGGNIISSVGESLRSTFVDLPSATFTLNGPNIVAIRFDSNNHHVAALSAVVIDNLQLVKMASSGNPRYQDAVLADSPSVYLRVGEMSGLQAIDISANGLHGTYENSVVYGAPGAVAGDPNTAIRLGNSNARIRIADSAQRRPAHVSVEAMVHSQGAEIWDSVISKTSDGWNDGYGIYYYPASGGELRFFVNGYTNYVSSPIRSNQFVHVAATYDGTTMKLYYDGVQVASKAYSAAIIHSNQPLYFGWAPGAASYSFNGTLDEPAVYETALTAAQILKHSQALQSIDIAPPKALSITRSNPKTATTTADSLVFFATFSEPVINVDVTDFAASSTSTAIVSNVVQVGTTNSYEVTVSGGNLASFNGTVGLNLSAANNIKDLAGLALLTAEPATDELYTISNRTGYENVVLANNPAVYLRFGETSGTLALDSSNNGLHGTYANSVGLGVPGAVAAVANTAAQFGNPNARVTIADNALLRPASLSLEAFVNVQGATTWDTVIAKTSGGWANGYGIYYHQDNGGELRFFVNSFTNYVSAPIPSNKYVHVVATYDGSIMQLYYDGVPVGTPKTINAAINHSTQPLEIGWAPSVSSYSFNGRIDEVAVFGQALTAAQVQSHYKAAASYSALIAADSPTTYWRLGEPGGTQATDSSTNGLHGTFENGVVYGAPGAIAGDSNTAVQFGGSSARIRVPDNALLRPSSISLEAIVNVQGAQAWDSVIAKTSAGWSDGYGIYYYPANGGELRFFVNGFTNFVAAPIGSHQNVHVVATYDGSSMKLYFDGVQVASKPFNSAIVHSNEPVYLGWAPGSATYSFNGTLDEVAMYSRALSAAAIQSHYARSVLQSFGFSGKIANPNDVDAYRISLLASGNLEVSLTTFTGLNGLVRLFNSSGTQVGGSLLANSGGGIQRLSINGLTAGDYYVSVSSQGNGTYTWPRSNGTGGTTMGAYQLKVTPSMSVNLDDLTAGVDAVFSLESDDLFDGWR